MISTNTRMTDKEDVAVLFYAMCKFGEQNDEIEMWPDSFGELLDRAEQAALILAEWHKDEGDDWNGVTWCERLDDTDEDGLAAQLFMLDNRALDAVSRTTMQWLKDL